MALDKPLTPRNVVVREARSSDAASIASIGAATFEASFGHSMPKEHLDDYLSTTYTEATFLKELSNPSDQFFIAELPLDDSSQSTPIGFIQVRKGSTEPCIPKDIPGIEIYRIYVSKDHLGAGAGKVLMERGIQWAEDQLAKQRGSSEEKALIWLGVWEENLKAQRFYARFGFEQVGTHDFVIGDTTQTDWIMRKWV